MYDNTLENCKRMLKKRFGKEVNPIWYTKEHIHNNYNSQFATYFQDRTLTDQDLYSKSQAFLPE